MGKFLIGMVSGGVLVASALAIGSIFFPPTSTGPTVSQPKEPAATQADTPALTEAEEAAQAPTEAKPVEAADSEPAAQVASEPADEPAPEPAPEPTPEPAPETAPETAPEPAPQPATSEAEPADEAEAEPAVEPAAEAAEVEPAAPAGTETAVAEENPAQPADPAEPAPAAETLTTEAAPAAEPAAQPETATAPATETAEAAPEALPEPAVAAVDAPAVPLAPLTLPQLSGDAVLSALDKAATDVPPPAPAESPVPEAPAPEAPAPEATVDPQVAEAAPTPAPAEEPTAEALAEPTSDSPASDEAPPATEVTEAAPPAAEATPEVAETAPAAEAPATEVAEAAPPVAEPAPEVAETAPPVEATPEIVEAAPEATDPEAPVTDEPAPGMVLVPEEAEIALPGTEAPEMPGSRPEALPGSDASEPEVAGVTEPAEEVPGNTFKPTPGLGNKTVGTIIGREPEEGTAAVEGEAEPVDTRPIAQFAATFENPDAKPLLSVVLIDTGAADLDRAALANLPFPVSFALDPLDPATPDRAAIYRSAGKEVVMLASGLAEGAQASDVEVAFQAMAQALPEAVAVMDLPDPAFQNRRPLASLVVPVVGAQGRGLVSWDLGLNAADQVARRDGIPATVVFRNLTAGGSDSAAIRRTLDRAIFLAGQSGRTTVAGEASPAVVAALLEWTIEGRAASVALAPVTAVLTVN